MICWAYTALFLVSSHLGLSGTPLRMSRRERMPNTPSRNITLQLVVSPTAIVSSEAKTPPKCQVPSMPMFTLPLYLGGRNSSTAVKIAVNYPPTLSPVRNLAKTNTSELVLIPDSSTPKK
jgi:hypothetical protein